MRQQATGPNELWCHMTQQLLTQKSGKTCVCLCVCVFTNLMPQHPLQPVLACASKVDGESRPTALHHHHSLRQQLVRQTHHHLNTHTYFRRKSHQKDLSWINQRQYRNHFSRYRYGIDPSHQIYPALTSPTQPSFCRYLRTAAHTWLLGRMLPPVTSSNFS